MRDTKLIQSLRKLSVSQLTRFADFLASPYFNKNTSNVIFYNFLRKYASGGFNSNKLKVETVLANLPLKHIKTARQLGDLRNELMGLLEKFLATEYLFENDFEWHKFAIEKARIIGMENVLPKLEKRRQQLLDQYDLRDTHYYKRLFQLKEEDLKNRNIHAREFNPLLQQASDTWDQYYLLRKLQYCWQMWAMDALYKEGYTHHMEEEILDWLKEHPWRKIPSISVLFSALEMLAHPNDTAYYFEFKSQLIAHGHLFSPFDRKAFFTGLLNYCTRRINKMADEAFLREYLTVNELLLENGLLIENGELSPWRYTNLKVAALKGGMDDWAWTFVHQYRDKLPLPYRDNLYQYAIGYIFYWRKQYHDAQRALAQVSFEDDLFNLALRSLLIRVYYDASEEAALLDQLEANRQYLRRIKASMNPNLWQQMENFNKFSAKLAKLLPSDLERLGLLREEIRGEGEVLHREWLLERVGE